MKKFRVWEPILGLMLIAAAAAGLFFWETQGRDAVFAESVVVAAQDIKPGVRITKQMLSEARVLRENKVKKASATENAERLVGKVAGQLIVKNSQLSELYFDNERLPLKKGESIFVLKPEWIAMCSSSLRRGDKVEVYAKRAGEPVQELGSYQIAYVRDSTQREVKNAAQPTENGEAELLSREGSTAPIASVEIICNIKQYEKITDEAGAGVEPSLLIVQRKEFQ